MEKQVLFRKMKVVLLLVCYRHDPNVGQEQHFLKKSDLCLDSQDGNSIRVLQREAVESALVAGALDQYLVVPQVG